MRLMHTTALATAALALSLSACSDDATSTAPSAGATSAWVLTAAPEGAKGVVELKTTAQEGDTVVLRGRIGGRMAPITEDSPVFVVMDLSIPHCGEKMDDHCPTPWDYCCETVESKTDNAATIQLVARDGMPLDESPMAQGFAALDEVIVVGTVGPRPNDKVLTVRATGVHRVGG
ncbi:MAG: hypothetical protein AAGG07_01135 [Planctomycetota bacterium]